MLCFFLACQNTPSPSPQKVQTQTTVQSSVPPSVATKPSVVTKPSTMTKPNISTKTTSAAPKPLKADKTIDTATQRIPHPPPVPSSKHQKIDVCAPYYQILELENNRPTSKDKQSEAARIEQLQALNRILEYHPEDMAQTLVELEKESFVGPIHLSIEQRTQYWKSIHLYIGSICRADTSIYRK